MRGISSRDSSIIDTIQERTRRERASRVSPKGACAAIPGPVCSPWFLFLTVMSSTASSANFQSILDAALDSYTKQTGIDLIKHPSAHKLQNCHSTEDIVQLLLERETAFKEYRDKYRKLIDCLRPVVQVVHAFSGTFAKAADLVGPSNRYI